MNLAPPTDTGPIYKLYRALHLEFQTEDLIVACLSPAGVLMSGESWGQKQEGYSLIWPAKCAPSAFFAAVAEMIQPKMIEPLEVPKIDIVDVTDGTSDFPNEPIAMITYANKHAYYTPLRQVLEPLATGSMGLDILTHAIAAAREETDPVAIDAIRVFLPFGAFQIDLKPQTGRSVCEIAAMTNRNIADQIVSLYEHTSGEDVAAASLKKTLAPFTDTFPVPWPGGGAGAGAGADIIDPGNCYSLCALSP